MIVDLLYGVLIALGVASVLFAVAYLAYNAIAAPGASLHMSAGLRAEMNENLVRVLIGIPAGIGMMIALSHCAPLWIVLPAGIVLGVVVEFVLDQPKKQFAPP